MINPRTVLKGGHAILSLLREGGRLEPVFGLLDAVNSQPEEVRRLESLVTRDPRLAQAVRERPRLGHVDLEALARLPEGTLGRAFVKFLRDNGLDPNALPVREAHDTASYLRAHLLETHDLWHVVTGFAADPASELGLQAFYLAQNRTRPSLSLLMTGFIGAFVRDFERHEALLTQVTRGWLLGRRARKLIGTDWKTLMDQPLEEVRARFDLDPARVDAVMREFVSPPEELPTARA